MKQDVKSENYQELEALLATAARLFFADGATREVAILADAQATLQSYEYDNGFGETRIHHCLNLEVPSWLYWQISDGREQFEKAFKQKLNEISNQPYYPYLDEVSIKPILDAGENWRDKAKRRLAGEGVNNQGRVRSDNIPSKSVDGLLFRSEQEIYLYKSFKSYGVSFAPLPVFVRGGETYKRIEPDFVIVKSGVIMAVEVDGDTVHHETPAEAHARTTMLAHEGVHVERVKASECSTQELANACAKRILQIIEKIKAAR
ncbi:MAG: hypothetical protein ACKVZH_01920 [Blastocatellia bacterium]